jgi:hypothetical protein
VSLRRARPQRLWVMLAEDASREWSVRPLASTGLVHLVMKRIARCAWRAGAARRLPSPGPAAPPATQGMSSAHGPGAPGQRVARAAPPPDRPAPPPAAAHRAATSRSAGETAAPRRAFVRADSPPRAPPGDGGDTVTPGSTRSSAPPAPSAARDAPARPGCGTPGSGSSGRDGAAPAAAPAESSASGLRPPPPVPPRRAASPPGSRRTPAAATFPRERGPPLPARIGRVAPDPPAPQRPRGRPPGTARPGPRDRARDAAPPRPAGPGQRVRLLLRPGRGLRGRVGDRQGIRGDAALLVQRLAGRVEGPASPHPIQGAGGVHAAARQAKNAGGAPPRTRLDALATSRVSSWRRVVYPVGYAMTR